MSRHSSDLGDAYDEGLDPEGPSGEDLDRFGSEFVTCANCHAEVYDQAPECPHCRHVIGAPVGMRRRKSTILVVLLLSFAMVGLLGFFQILGQLF